MPRDKDSRYYLKNESEWDRLEFQQTHPLYSLETELSKELDSIPEGSSVLDAGCGSCLVSKQLSKLNKGKNIIFDALDADKEMLNRSELENKRNGLKLNYIQDDLTTLSTVTDGYYDRYYTRFTCQHNYTRIDSMIEQSIRVLKSGGIATFIDADGIFSNFLKDELGINSTIEKVRSFLPNYSNEISSIILENMKSVGFQDISTSKFPMEFNNQALITHESQIWLMRLDQLKPILKQVLGENASEDFIQKFIKEINNPKNCLRYDKYILRGIKK